jgi:chromosome segregation ATPase
MLAIRGLALLALTETSYGSEHSANPIRRVVTMLQDMQSKVAEEGKKEKELFDKFMCYCQTGAADLNAAIDGASNKAPQTESAIEEGNAKKAQLEAEVEKHQTDRADCKTAIASAIALRDKTAATYAEESTELKSEIQTIKDTLKALQIMGAAQSMGGGAFLQTATAMKAKKLAINMDLSPADRDQLLGFLSMENKNVGPAIGILSQMEKTMEKDLAELSAT